MSTAIPSTIPPADTNTIAPLMIDAKRLAALLSVSEKTIRRWDVAGKIPRPIRLSSAAIRWSRSTIEAWLQACEEAGGRLVDRREFESLQSAAVDRKGLRR